MNELLAARDSDGRLGRHDLQAERLIGPSQLDRSTTLSHARSRILKLTHHLLDHQSGKVVVAKGVWTSPPTIVSGQRLASFLGVWRLASFLGVWRLDRSARGTRSASEAKELAKGEWRTRQLGLPAGTSVASSLKSQASSRK